MQKGKHSAMLPGITLKGVIQCPVKRVMSTKC